MHDIHKISHQNALHISTPSLFCFGPAVLETRASSSTPSKVEALEAILPRHT